MNTDTEILQIVNLSLMINRLGGHQVVLNISGESAHFCAFIYPHGSQAPVDYLHTFTDKPEAYPQLRLIRQQLEFLLSNEEAKAQQEVAA